MDTALLIVALALGSGGLTGLVVLYWQLRSEREERMRDRKIAAATDFSATVTRGLACVRVWLSADRTKPSGREEAQAALREVQARFPEVVAEHARVDLLFGEPSPVYDAADALARAYIAVMKELESTSADAEKARELRDAAADALDGFTKAVHKAVR